VRALLWPRFACWAWTHPATVVAGRTFEGAALASVSLVGVDFESHCVGRKDR
jgi:hypothetical protein